MTFPRRLLWKEGELLTPPVEGVAALRDGLVQDGLPGADAVVGIAGGLAEIEIGLVTPGAPFRLDFDHPTHGLALVYDGASLELLIEPPGHRVIPRYVTKASLLRRLTIYVDVGLIEVFADGGRLCGTKRIDSDDAVTSFRVSDAAGIGALRAWKLRPAGGALPL
jgi:beta-fructofuranosidase